MSEQELLLIEHLRRLDKWELIRLKSCFEYEYKIEVENREALDQILSNIRNLLEEMEKSNV